MRLVLLLIAICLVFVVVVECKSRKDSKSKSPGSKTSGSGGKVTKTRVKPVRHSSDSSESSEEQFNKHRKKHKHSDKFKSEESFDSRKRNTTIGHKIGSKHNTTWLYGEGFNNTGKHFSFNNASYLGVSKTNNTHLNVHTQNNKTLIGWKNYTNPNMSQPNNSNVSNSLTNFLQNEKGIKNTTGIYLHSNNSMLLKNNVTTLPYGWKIVNATAPSNNWKNINATPPLYGWQNNPNSVQEWNIQPSAPDYRKVFSVPDQRQDHIYYPSGSGGAGYLQRNPNSINDPNQPVPFPVVPENNRRVISNIAPEYSWGPLQPSNVANDNFNTDRHVYNSYPIYKSYGSSEESSSKMAKGAKKMFKKLAKGTGKILSNDNMKDVGRQVASSYFANPPPNGWIYNPPLDNPKQIFYGRFSNPVGKESFSADDWRSIIFGNVPMKVNTRNLYSATFPETYQNFNLSPFSEKGRLPDFNQTQYRAFFSRPYYQKLFAGLQTEHINEQFRAKRELSEKGKAMADVINKFFLHERDCNDTELNARRKRQIMIKPIGKKSVPRYDKEYIITNFPFSGVEAVVQSDNGITVYEDVPKETQLENHSTEGTIVYDQNTRSLESGNKNILSTVEPSLSTPPNRTKLYPVSETIEQFLNKEPRTHLRVVDESLEKWKARTSSHITSNSEHSAVDSGVQKVNESSWKRVTRSQDKGLSPKNDLEPLYLKYINDEADVRAPYVTELYRNTLEGAVNNKEIMSSEESFFQDIEEFIPNTNSYTSPVLNSDKVYTHQRLESNPRTSTREPTTKSSRNGFYFFGAYINDYNHQLENHATIKSLDASFAREITGEDISSDESLEDASASKENENTSSVPSLNSDLRDGSMRSSIAIPVLSYSSQSENSENYATSRYLGASWNHKTSGKEMPFDESSEASDSEVDKKPSSMPSLHDNLRDGLMKSSIAIPAPSYSNRREKLSTENFQITSESLQPVWDGWLSDSKTSKPSKSVYVPFKINKISSVNYLDEILKAQKNLKPNDSEPITPKESIITAPLFKINCGKNERPVKNRCRKIW